MYCSLIPFSVLSSNDPMHVFAYSLFVNILKHKYIMINGCLATEARLHLIPAPLSYAWECRALMMEPLPSSSYDLSFSVDKYLWRHVSWCLYISLCLEGESWVCVYLWIPQTKRPTENDVIQRASLLPSSCSLDGLSLQESKGSLHYVWAKCFLLGKQTSYETNLLNKYIYLF